MTTQIIIESILMFALFANIFIMGLATFVYPSIKGVIIASMAAMAAAMTLDYMSPLAIL